MNKTDLDFSSLVILQSRHLRLGATTWILHVKHRHEQTSLPSRALFCPNSKLLHKTF